MHNSSLRGSSSDLDEPLVPCCEEEQTHTDEEEPISPLSSLQYLPCTFFPSFCLCLTAQLCILWEQESSDSRSFTKNGLIYIGMYLGCLVGVGIHLIMLASRRAAQEREESSYPYLKFACMAAGLILGEYVGDAMFWKVFAGHPLEHYPDGVRICYNILSFSYLAALVDAFIMFGREQMMFADGGESIALNNRGLSPVSIV